MTFQRRRGRAKGLRNEDASRPGQGPPEGTPSLAPTTSRTPSLADPNAYTLTDQPAFTAAFPPTLRARIGGSMGHPPKPKAQAKFP